MGRVCQPFRINKKKMETFIFCDAVRSLHITKVFSYVKIINSLRFFKQLLIISNLSMFASA